MFVYIFVQKFVQNVCVCVLLLNGRLITQPINFLRGNISCCEISNPNISACMHIVQSENVFIQVLKKREREIEILENRMLSSESKLQSACYTARDNREPRNAILSLPLFFFITPKPAVRARGILRDMIVFGNLPSSTLFLPPEKCYHSAENQSATHTAAMNKIFPRTRERRLDEGG